jgi:hypothetical protein
MPTEINRVNGIKKVKLPSGATVTMNVITQITFLDPVDRAQETQYAVDNSNQSHRDVHVDNVYFTPPGQPIQQTGSTSDALPVERIDLWRVKDSVERGQETFIAPDNKTMNQGVPPPWFVTHKKTHVLRYKNQPDDGNWIDTEVIDQLWVKDPVDRAQETQYTLQNSQGTDDGQGNMVVYADQNAPDITSSGSVDPPWRIDPFQNIVNLQGVPPYIIFGIRPVVNAKGGVSNAMGGDTNFTPFPSGYAFSRGYTTGQIVSRFPSSSPTIATSPVVLVNWSGVSISNSIDFSPYQYLASFGESALGLAGVLKLNFSGSHVYVDPDTGKPALGGGYFTDAVPSYQIYCWDGNGPHDYYAPPPPAAPITFQGSYMQTNYGGGDFSNTSAIAHGTMVLSGSWSWSGLTLSPVDHPSRIYNAVAMSANGDILCRIHP